MTYLITIIFILACLLYIPAFRRSLLSKYFMRWFINRLPSLSKTEMEALESGEAWIEASLFRGKPDWKKIKDLALSELTQEECDFLKNETTTLCKMIDDWRVINEDHDLSPQVWQYLKDKSFLGLTIERDYGGKGFSAVVVSMIIQKISSRSFTAGATVMIPNSLGLGELFSHFGTEQQKRQFLPDLAVGKHIGCFALTGPEVGSDASSIPDIGIVCHDIFEGKKVLGIKLTFSKRYISLAPVSTLVGLAFKLRDPDRLLNGIGQEGITCCYIPRGHSGLVIGDRHYPCSMPAMNGPLQGKDVFVPIEWIIGGQVMAGKGWSILMSALSIGRAVSLPAFSHGLITTHYVSTSAYATLRKQFGQSIGQFEGVQVSLANIAGLTYIAEATRALTYTAIDNHVEPSVASAITKYHVTEIGRSVINDALDIHGGRGIMDGPKNYLTGHYRGLLISITGEGANIMTRHLLIFAQAMTRCHPFLLDLIHSATMKDIVKFDKIIWKMIRNTCGNILRVQYLRLTRGVFVQAIPQGSLSIYAKQLSFLSAVFSVVSDIIILQLGNELKKREQICANLADMLSYLYLGVAVIKYHQTYSKTREENTHAEWALIHCIYQCQEAYFDLLSNFSNRFLGYLLKLKTFPFGRRFKKPSHTLNIQLANEMQTLSDFRKRLKNQFYIEDSQIGLVESAFEQYDYIRPIREKLAIAIDDKKISRKTTLKEQLAEAVLIKCLTTDEEVLYRQFLDHYWEVINVNVFDAELKTIKS